MRKAATTFADQVPAADYLTIRFLTKRARRDRAAAMRLAAQEYGVSVYRLPLRIVRVIDELIVEGTTRQLKTCARPSP